MWEFAADICVQLLFMMHIVNVDHNAWVVKRKRVGAMTLYGRTKTALDSSEGLPVASLTTIKERI